MVFVNRVGDVTPIRLSVGSERQVGLGSVSDLKDELGNVEGEYQLHKLNRPFINTTNTESNHPASLLLGMPIFTQFV